jgi:polysaccharide export outer membrane protein
MRPGRVLVLVLAVLALAVSACARHAHVAAPVADPVVAAPLSMAPEEMPYTLDSGDRLRIVVFGQEGLSTTYAVDASGNITMPLIGAVHARGATPASLSRAIADKLRQGYIREPHVAVEIETYRPFFILGEVTAPGQYPYVPNMTVENAVAIAGGFTPRAQRRQVTLSRIIDGIPTRGPVPVITPMRPGDTIVVPERWF